MAKRESDKLHKNIDVFKKKFYRNLLLKGVIITFSLLVSYFLVVSLIEISTRPGTLVRGIILFSFIAAFAGLVYVFVIRAFQRSLNPDRSLTDEEAAKRIGRIFPQIRDRLLNIIQLEKLRGKNNRLVEASIRQKSGGMHSIDFSEAIRYSSNRKYLRFLVPPVLLALVLLIAAPQAFYSSTTRIINYNEEFKPLPPFNFVLMNNDLTAFKNEDFTVDISVEGSALPDQVYIVSNKRKLKMVKTGNGEFEYTFQKLQNDKKFFVEGAGFSSPVYELSVVTRPNIRNFNVYLDYPSYLGKQDQRLSNVGNLEVPEGTRIKWEFNTLNANAMAVEFSDSEGAVALNESSSQLFDLEKRIMESVQYSIILENEFSTNGEKIVYDIQVVPDQYPVINVNIYQDTVFYNFMAIGGNISDDYGLTRLNLNYQRENNGSKEEFKKIDIPIQRSQNSQGFFYQWRLDSLDLKGGDQVNYFLQVWDNDGVNGVKSSKTGTYVFKIPTKEEIEEQLENAANSTKDQIDETLQDAQELNEMLEEAEDRLKGKRNLDWQDEKLLKELLEKKKELNDAIEDLQEQNKLNNFRKDRFSEQQNEQIRDKVNKLQELMDELLDEETRKLYEELQKLLEEQSNSDQIQDILQKLNYKEENLEKELERTLELFKRMKFEQELEETIEDIEDLGNKQEELAEETESKESDNQELMDKQEELNEEFEDFEKSLEELEEMNQDLKNPEPLQDYDEENQQIREMQEMSQEMLEKNKNQKAGESQRNAAEKMKQLQKKLQQMQGNMELMSMQANLGDLRDILHNLLKLSFDQEDLMKEFKEVNQSDPRFVELSQQQLKLKDDAQIIEDSLLSLAERVVQIQSYVTREVSEMNKNMDESLEAIRDRKKARASSKQQFTMTSINNLALMLNQTMEQMSMALADAMGNPQKGKEQSEQNNPGLGELQKQLNQRIQQLKQSGKSGRELSEELAKLAAEQERIRRALQEMEERYGTDPTNPGMNEIMEKMEETELDLVNKQITDETIKRQQEIVTRLLEAEESMRERELDEQREGETASEQYEEELPKAFEEYFKLKEKEIEYLKTIPLKLYPYYKQEVNEYFKRLRDNNE